MPLCPWALPALSSPATPPGLLPAAMLARTLRQAAAAGVPHRLQRRPQPCSHALSPGLQRCGPQQCRIVYGVSSGGLSSCLCLLSCRIRVGLPEKDLADRQRPCCLTGRCPRRRCPSGAIRLCKARRVKFPCLHVALPTCTCKDMSLSLLPAYKTAGLLCL